MQLEKGQLFGEDECLMMVLNNGELEGELKPSKVYYNVTCESIEGEILCADLEDIWRILKNEKPCIQFLKEQYCLKFPDQ